MQLAATWRRRWDSNPRAGSSPTKRFRVVLVTTTSILLRICQPRFPGVRRLFSFVRIPVRTGRSIAPPNPQKISCAAASGAFRFPSPGLISSAARYDHFDTLPYNKYSVFGESNMISSAAPSTTRTTLHIICGNGYITRPYGVNTLYCKERK